MSRHLLCQIILFCLFLFLCLISPDDSSKGHEAGGDDHGESEGVSQEPDHWYEADDVEDGAVVGQQGDSLVGPAEE